MKQSKYLLILSSCAFVLSGCATKPKDIISLPTTVQKEICSTDVYVEECEKKMKADIEASNVSTYTGGGLAFALVDCAIMAHREGCADDALIELQKEIQTFNFQEKYRNRLTHAFQNTNWLRVKKVNYLVKLDDSAHEEIFRKANTDAVLTSKFIYKLNPEFTVLTGTLYVTVYPTHEKLKKLVSAEHPLDAPIFKVHFSAAEQLPVTGASIEENAKYWAENNGQHLRKSLDSILNQIFVKLDQALKKPNFLPGA